MLPKGVGDAIGNIPTGGLSPQAVADRQQARAGNPEVAETTTEIGRAPTDMQGTAKALEKRCRRPHRSSRRHGSRRHPDGWHAQHLVVPECATGGRPNRCSSGDE